MLLTYSNFNWICHNIVKQIKGFTSFVSVSSNQANNFKSQHSTDKKRAELENFIYVLNRDFPHVCNFGQIEDFPQKYMRLPKPLSFSILSKA